MGVKRNGNTTTTAVAKITIIIIIKTIIMIDHRGNPDSIPADFKGDSLWTNWHWDTAFSQFFSFPLLIIIPPLLHIHSSQPHQMCDSPDQAALSYPRS
jgi:hypothetical protein